MHVFVLALGPVQDFIAAARRTRDLWFGSWMLSELARAAGQAIETSCGTGSLIFPASTRLKHADATFANKIVARISGAPEEVGQLVREAIATRLEELRSEAFKKIEANPAFHGESARLQIADLVEIQWASAPEGAEGYHDARKEAERLLGARKQCRLFGPVTWGKAVPKSSIDGLRESVIDESAFETALPIELYKAFRADAAERLCGVSLLKRLGRRTSKRFFAHHFLSTGHLAAGPLLDRLRLLQQDEVKNPQLQTAWTAIDLALREAGVDLTELQIFAEEVENPYLGRFDAGILYESRLPDLFPDEKLPRERRERAKPILEKVNKFLELTGVKTPCPYYAILHADGDRMGSTIEGIEDFERHRALSSQLSRFADEARTIVETRHSGELVYAGGDDVLALLPLHKAIGCARALADDFAERLKGFGQEGAAPTLSVGIAVVHFLDPLQRSVCLARRAEAKAKEARDRFELKSHEPKSGPDAEGTGTPEAPRGGLAVSFDKRSGAVLHLVGTWGDLDVELDVLTGLHVQERISDKAGFELRELARLTHKTEGSERTSLEDLVKKEALRVLLRKRSRRGEEEVEDVVISRIEKMFRANPSLDSFADRLIGARLLAEAQLQSQLETAPETPEEVQP